MARQGVLVDPYQRLKLEQVEQLHRASLAILTDPGVVCFNREAAEIFGDHGAEVSSIDQENAACWLLKIPEKVINEAVPAAPGVVKLGARDENNCLILDGQEPRVCFASGSEANNWLDVDVETFISKRNPRTEVQLPVFRVEKGNMDRLAKAARLCEHLEHWDSFLRTVNIQDDDINDENKDVNKFFVSLNNTTKHVMSGLTDLSQLSSVVRVSEIIAGGGGQVAGESNHLFHHLPGKKPSAAYR
ncbi:trimethylamine methyltransferase family protein [Chloroflexota bacterium]